MSKTKSPWPRECVTRKRKPYYTTTRNGAGVFITLLRCGNNEQFQETDAVLGLDAHLVEVWRLRNSMVAA